MVRSAKRGQDRMDKVCCFCGRRSIPAGERPLLEERLAEEIVRLAGQRVTRFLTGGAPGFDTLAARAVLRVRESGGLGQLRLVLVLPCEDPTWGWTPREAAAHRELSARADLRVTLALRYFPGCIQRQGRYLVDHSDLCLCSLDPGQPWEYARYTAAYARKQGVLVAELRPAAGRLAAGR